MKTMRVLLTFPDGAAVHRVIQAVRTLYKDAGVADRPEIQIVAGDPAEAVGVATQLRQIGVDVDIHESLEPATVQTFDRGAIPERIAALTGSDSFPSHVEINGEMVQLGTLVAKAQQLSGFSVDTWNRLQQDQRDDFIDTAIEAIRTQDPTAPQHEVTAEEFADALKGKQDQIAAEKASAAFSARTNAEHADVLGEQEKTDNPAVHAELPTLDFAADTTESTQGGQDATGPAPDGSEASTTTDGSASE